MKRYQALILSAVEKSTYSRLAIAIEAPKTSVQEWATHSYKVPQYKSLEKIAAYFSVPIPTLIMEHNDPRIAIIDIMYQLDDQRLSVLQTHASILL